MIGHLYSERGELDKILAQRIYCVMPRGNILYQNSFWFHAWCSQARINSIAVGYSSELPVAPRPVLIFHFAQLLKHCLTKVTVSAIGPKTSNISAEF